MSAIQDSPAQVPTTPSPRTSGGGLPAVLNSGWAWMVIACALIATTGILRTRQDRLLGIEKSTFQPCPFNLDDIPEQIGNWKNDPTQIRQLDDKTVQITGSTDHIVRTYVDDLTGSRLSILLLYGPAEPVLPHTPEVCYPATGFVLDGPMGLEEVPYGENFAQFWTATYTRPGTIVSERARVYYSFRLDGKYSPYLGRGMKFHRNNPGLFKIQLQRVMREGEKPDKNEPIEKFLGLLIPDLERRIADGSREASESSDGKSRIIPAEAHATSGSSPNRESDNLARTTTTGE